MNVTINVPLEAVLILGALILIQIIAKVIVGKMITKHSKELSGKQTKAICNMMQPFTLIQFHSRKKR